MDSMEWEWPNEPEHEHQAVVDHGLDGIILVTHALENKSMDRITQILNENVTWGNIPWDSTTITMETTRAYSSLGLWNPGEDRYWADMALGEVCLEQMKSRWTKVSQKMTSCNSPAFPEEVLRYHAHRLGLHDKMEPDFTDPLVSTDVAELISKNDPLVAGVDPRDSEHDAMQVYLAYIWGSDMGEAVRIYQTRRDPEITEDKFTRLVASICKEYGFWFGIRDDVRLRAAFNAVRCQEVIESDGMVEAKMAQLKKNSDFSPAQLTMFLNEFRATSEPIE